MPFLALFIAFSLIEKRKGPKSTKKRKVFFAAGIFYNFLQLLSLLRLLVYPMSNLKYLYCYYYTPKLWMLPL